MESLTPPPELRKQWIDESPGIALDGRTRVGTDWNTVMDKAAAWGAAQAEPSGDGIISAVTCMHVTYQGESMFAGPSTITLKLINESGSFPMFELREIEWEDDQESLLVCPKTLEVIARNARTMLNQSGVNNG